ncbi:MAG: hypothetical protein Q8K07_08240 [Methylicorpusculum sp.]|nr:hypothetical protein [Methylicorpusculum sp.]MDP2201991.1 hypothetical protein [Methylicorpusculum sp.]
MIVSFSLFISACSHQPDINYNFRKTEYKLPSETFSLEKIKETSKVKISESEFDKYITFKGIESKHEPDVYTLDIAKIEKDTSFVVAANTFFIRSLLDKNTGVVVWHQIYLTDYHAIDWNNWYSASDEKANELKLQNISHEVDCSPCKYTEIVGITVPNNLINENRNTGFRIKLRAKSGEEKIISVTSEQISAQLDAIASKNSFTKNK